MDKIVRLSRREGALLQAAAEKFVAECDGDVWKALKSMIVLNGELTEKFERHAATPPPPAPAPAKPARKPRPTVQQQFQF